MKSLAEQLRQVWPTVVKERERQSDAARLAHYKESLKQMSAKQLRDLLTDPVHEHHRSYIYNELQSRKCASGSKRQSSRSA